MAFLPAPETARILSASLPPRTAVSTTGAVVKARIAALQTQGRTEALSTFKDGVQGFAVPRFNAQSHPVGAVAVAAAMPQMNAPLRATITTQLTRAGAEINALWGGSVPPTLETQLRALRQAGGRS